MRKRRRQFSLEEIRTLHRRFRNGERLTDIASELSRSTGCIHQKLEKSGGFSPAERKRSALALTASEREQIFRGLGQEESISAIARRIGRSASTVWREVGRNGGAERYSAVAAEQNAWKQAERPKRCKLATSPQLAQMVGAKLIENWSPQQISAWLHAENPNSPELFVSHETIYKTLFIQARGALKKELTQHLRRARGMRKPKRTREPKSVIPNITPISERPAEVEDRAVPGHWEGDLIAGANNQSFIGTLVERHTRYVKLVQVKSKDATEFAEALKREILRLPAHLRLSLTWDRGTEMAKHQDFTLATNVTVYFCDPHKPWQRGSNENTNGLLRQYFPKGTDLSGFTQAHLDTVAAQLNGRPRETLGWRNPAQKLNELIAATG